MWEGEKGGEGGTPENNYRIWIVFVSVFECFKRITYEVSQLGDCLRRLRICVNTRIKPRIKS